MMDLKGLRSALEQLEEERGIPKDKIIGAIEDALVAAYKKDYAKKSQIITAKLDMMSGAVQFAQVKLVVDESTVDMNNPSTEMDEVKPATADGVEEKPRFNDEQHILLQDARKIKRDAALGDELIFPLETKDDYGRIAAQTAKQVIIQRIREAEKVSTLSEYADKEGTIISGKVQKMERGNVFVDLGRVTGILPREEQIPGEYYRQGERIKAYLYQVEETPRGINLRLSRSHPKLIQKLFEIEAPEVASGAVELKAIAREPGARSKIAVASNDPSIDPVGSCVGQKGARVNTVTNELGGEKIDIIEWSTDAKEFIASALSPAKINEVRLNEADRIATIEVPDDQFSLAVGRGGQNARLAAKLTGWKIDIVPPVNQTPAPEATPTEAASSESSETLPA